MTDIQPLWTPNPERIAAANMTRFIEHVNRKQGLQLSDYPSLYRWSIDEKECFWSEIWDFCGIVGDKGERILVDGERIEIYALRNIQPGVELAYDYNLTRKGRPRAFWKWLYACRCGAAKCRGTLLSLPRKKSSKRKKRA